MKFLLGVSALLFSCSALAGQVSAKNKIDYSDFTTKEVVIIIKVKIPKCCCQEVKLESKPEVVKPIRHFDGRGIN